MKKAIIGIIGGLVLLAGVVLICYPFICDYSMNQSNNDIISRQRTAVENADDSLIKDMFKRAEEYNRSLVGEAVEGDPFSSSPDNDNDSEYENLLNLNNDSVMASLEIPKIGVKLAVYHGTSKETLLKGVGHLKGSSLPIGGKGTHAVLNGHSGLSNAALFTDLDKLELGDVFYIHVLDRVLAYQTDRIKTVLPSDTSDIQIDREEDYVTLVTCTPIGVNSHRLLVRGRRVPLDKAESILKSTKTADSSWMQDYKRIVLISAAVVAVVVAIVFFIVIRRYFVKRRRKG